MPIVISYDTYIFSMRGYLMPIVISYDTYISSMRGYLMPIVINRQLGQLPPLRRR